MKTILEFNLPEDQPDLDLALQAPKMHSVLWDMEYEVFRKVVRYNASNNEKLQELLQQHPEVTMQVVETIRKMFFELLEENNIDI